MSAVSASEPLSAASFRSSGARLQNEGIGSPVVGIIHADGQLGVVQTVGGQLLIGDLKLMVQEDALVKANAVLQ